jgi:molybdopterin-guanine dinucleotide biosynthesis protein A
MSQPPPAPPAEADTTLCILAGGKGERLGADKSRILLNRRPVLFDLLARFVWTGPTILVKSSTAQRVAGEEKCDHVVVDRFPGEGPLGGIVSALASARTSALLVLPIDQIRITRTHAVELMARVESSSVACFHRTRQAKPETIEPLPMWIDRRLADETADMFRAGGRSLRSLLQRPDAKVIAAPADWPADVWMNVNDRADLAAAGGTIQPD